MGKIFQSAEVPRVYCGSFREEPLQRKEFEKLFEKDRTALMSHLSELPKMCGMRKINEMVKRIRLNIVNVCIIGNLKSKMPYLWGFEKTQKKLIENLDQIYLEVRHTYNLPEGDFPPIDEFKAGLQVVDFRRFPQLKRETLNQLKELLSIDIPIIFKSIAGVTSNKIGVNDNDDEGNESENRNLQAIMNFDFNSFDKHTNSNLVQNIIPFITAFIFLVIAILISYFIDNGVTLKKFIAQLKASP